MSDHEQDLALALELAGEADAITLGRFRSSGLVVETKPDLTPVSEADTAVERMMRERLAVVRPGDAVVGEEFGSSGGAPDSGRRWIVDPIDGTASYVRGIPVWATLLALEEAGRVAVGVVSAPALGRRWWAARGSGAHALDALAAEPRGLRVSSVRRLEDAQLCFSDTDTWEERGRLEGLLALSRRCWRTRGLGDFWQYMLVAEGAADIGCEAVVSLWDLAAPQIIVEEAGGTFTDLAGVATADGGNALATNGMLHQLALAVLGR